MNTEELEVLNLQYIRFLKGDRWQNEKEVTEGEFVSEAQVLTRNSEDIEDL